MSLEGKIALVTGASRGLGQAIMLRLAQEGAVVLGTATSQAGVDSIATKLAEHKYTGHGFIVDVTDPSAIDAMMVEIQLAYGPPAILINNAGITRDNLLLRLSDDDWAQVINTNLNSVYRMSKACLKSMVKARWGRIINLSSISGIAGSSGQTNYAAAKAGIIGFTKSLAQEVASRNITVNAVAPGFIDTDMTRILTEAQQQLILQKVPMGFIGKPQHVAGVVAFLCSDDAAYMTGVTLHVNGGMYVT